MEGIDHHLVRRLANGLADVPRWVETRGMLLSGESEVSGLEEIEELSFVVCNPEMKLASVVGRPATEAIARAAARIGDTGAVLTPPETSDRVADALPRWIGSTAALHVLDDSSRVNEYSPEGVHLLPPGEIKTIPQLPPDLRAELITASRHSPIAARFVEHVPVSFCYVSAQTESLWDISIDTLAEYRGRGHAAPCVSFMINLMRGRGKEPVWGAEVGNFASIKLAAKLGFAPVDQLIVFRPNESA